MTLTICYPRLSESVTVASWAAGYHRLVDVDAGHNLAVAGASQLHDELEFRAELAQPSPISLNTLKSEVVIL